MLQRLEGGVEDRRRAGGGAVAGPQRAAIGAALAVERSEHHLVADHGKSAEAVAGEAVLVARLDVLHHRGPRGSAVGGPQFIAVGAVIRLEQNMRSQRCQVRREARVAGAGVDILDQRGAGGGTVGDPQLGAMHPVIGGEQGLVAKRSQFLRIAAEKARTNIEHHRRIGRLAVGDPKLIAMRALAGEKHHMIAGLGEQRGALVHQHRGAERGPVGDP